jgi:rhodanese-related sulfurtransferase
VGFLARLFWWLPFGSVSEIFAPELKDLLESDSPPFLIDVRTAREFREGHIAGAVHLPVGELKRKLERGDLARELADSRRVVAICLSAHRSIPAVRLLSMNGYPHAVQLQGGMRAWIDFGRTVPEQK